MHISDKTRVFEITAVILTGSGKFLFVDYLNLKFWYITVSCTLWAGYIVFRIMNDKAILPYWGFRRDGFRDSLKWILPMGLAACLVFVSYGILKDKLILNWHILPVMVLYPVWGTIQQFLIIALIARNLSDFQKISLRKSVIVLIASVVFSMVHFPSLQLVVATFLLALVYSVIYLQYRNLWVLGLFHGWLGCFFYYFVLGRDTWREFVQSVVPSQGL